MDAQDRAEAASMRSAAASTLKVVAWADLGAQCVIDDDAVQKYVLIECTNQGEKRCFVRGDANAGYHKDAARPFVTKCRQLGLSFEVLGGGRIDHSTKSKQVRVYGFSYGFPWRGDPMHDVTASLIRKDYPTFDVTTSNEGY